MKVYQLHGKLDGLQNLAPENDEARKFILDYFNYETIEQWKSVKVVIHKDAASNYDGRDFPPSDYPEIGVMPVFSCRAVEALREVLNDNGKLLPLVFEGKTNAYYAWKPTRIADVLNEAESEVKRFKSGKVMNVISYEFEPEKIDGLTIFKIPQQRGRLYVTDEFIQRVEEAGLTGFSFKLLWTYQPEHVLVAA